ncbi:MAG: STAS domain-containing protein [Candidatus Eisenbacteria bacterium]|nr:STAS domain-containing protein [Candidatus Latescibacterota bacterium]MBD3303076.1 STAS domain-containing protein [Candidatus Eisenbacteria bacterium]
MTHENAMRSPVLAGGPEWVEQPRGALRRPEFRRLASRLEGVPSGTKEVWIDCREVSHLDYRIGGEILLLLRRLRSRGVGLRFVGIDPYLRTLLRLSLAEEELAQIAGETQITEFAEESGQPSAGPRSAGLEELVRRFAPESVSRN